MSSQELDYSLISGESDSQLGSGEAATLLTIENIYAFVHKHNLPREGVIALLQMREVIEQAAHRAHLTRAEQLAELVPSVIGRR